MLEIKSFDEFASYIGYPLRVTSKESYYTTKEYKFNNILSINPEKEELRVVVFREDKDYFEKGDSYKILIIDFYGGKYKNPEDRKYYISINDTIKKNEKRYIQFIEYLGKFFFEKTYANSLSLKVSDEEKTIYLENKLKEQIFKEIGAFRGGVLGAYSAVDKEKSDLFQLKLFQENIFELGKWYKYSDYYYFTNELKEEIIKCYVISANEFLEQSVHKDDFEFFELVKEGLDLEIIKERLDNLKTIIKDLKYISL